MMIGCSSHHHALSGYTYTVHPGVESGEEMRVYVDVDFGDFDRMEIKKGIDAWNYGMNGVVKMRVVMWNFDMEEDVLRAALRGEVVVMMKIRGDSQLIREGKDGKVVLAFCDKVGGHFIYVVRNRIENEDMRGIVMHEFGHIMGSFHTAHGLMQAGYEREEYLCIDRFTMTEVAKFRGIELSRLNWCYGG